MLSERKPIKVEQAIEKIMLQEIEGKIVEIDFKDSHERVLAEDIFATHPVPPFTKSPYDGFALKASDTRNADENNPVIFEVTERIGAGSQAKKSLEEGQAVRIMTGAEVPPGADCIAMLEVCNTYQENQKYKMAIKEKLEAGQNIVERGSETNEGQLIVKRGTRINPGVQALLATFGYDKVKVAKKPIVGILATGSELLDVDEPLEPGKIRNSNAHMVAAQIKRAGGNPKYLGKLADDFDSSYQEISQALESVDVLITTGGVSVGDFDLLPDIYQKLNAEVLFNKIAMRPGSVTTVARKDGKFLFGLSGNPSACYVGFELFARPVLNVLLRSSTPFLKSMQAELSEDFLKPNPFARFVRSKVYFEEGLVKVYAVGKDKSAVVTSLAETNALMLLPGGTKGFRKGDKVNIMLLESETGETSFKVNSFLL